MEFNVLKRYDIWELEIKSNSVSERLIIDDNHYKNDEIELKTLDNIVFELKELDGSEKVFEKYKSYLIGGTVFSIKGTFEKKLEVNFKNNFFFIGEQNKGCYKTLILYSESNEKIAYAISREYKKRRESFLDILAVDSNERNKNYGTLLLKILEQVSSINSDIVWCRPLPKKNVKGFYINRGYRETIGYSGMYHMKILASEFDEELSQLK